MSFSISQNEAKPWAKNSVVKPLPSASFQTANPAVSSRNQLTSDTVRFGAKKTSRTEQATETESPKQSAVRASRSNKGQPDHARTYGHKENNLREAARIALCDIAPLALSVLPLVGIPGLGFAFALATLPLSYASGKLGRNIAKNVDPEDLTPGFQYIHKVKHALTTAHDGKSGNVVDSINKATDDLLNLRNMPGIVTSTILPMLKVQPGGWVSKALTKMNGVALMRAEVNIRLAQAENGKDAVKAGANGVKDFAIYSAMNKLGVVLTASTVPGAKMAGEFLKNAAWVKIAADLLRSREKRPPDGKT